jgi:myo-inositol-1(or 4)-monophosphatase
MTVTLNFSSTKSSAPRAAARMPALRSWRCFAASMMSMKKQNNPVTTADLEANRIIRERIANTFPGDGWLFEEDADSERRLTLSRVWVVDPIDGTKEFIEGVPQFAISIGFVVDGVAQAAVVYNPAQKEFKAAAGHGAFER